MRCNVRGRGWFGESYRHYLASKGVGTVRRKYQRRFSDLVKNFPGENPRLTVNFARFRQRDPSDFVSGSFRVKDFGGKKILVGKLKSNGRFAVQSVLVDRGNYWSVKRVFKKGSVRVTRSGEEVRREAFDILRGISKWAVRAEVAGSIRRGVDEPVDVDIVVVPKDKEKIRDFVRRRASKVFVDGDRRISALVDGVRTDVVFADGDEFGAALLTFTGPVGANIQKRKLAKEKGWLLNEKGLFDGRGRRIASSEQGIYKALGRSYRVPAFRGLPR